MQTASSRFWTLVTVFISSYSRIILLSFLFLMPTKVWSQNYRCWNGNSQASHSVDNMYLKQTIIYSKIYPSFHSCYLFFIFLYSSLSFCFHSITITFLTSSLASPSFLPSILLTFLTPHLSFISVVVLFEKALIINRTAQNPSIVLSKPMFKVYFR